MPQWWSHGPKTPNLNLKVFLYSNNRTSRVFKAVVLNLFYISCPFIKQDYQIYIQYTQWCSYIQNTKLTNSYSLEWFIKVDFCCNFWFSKFTHFWRWNIPPQVNLPQVKNHCFRWFQQLSTSICYPVMAGQSLPWEGKLYFFLKLVSCQKLFFSSTI